MIVGKKSILFLIFRNNITFELTKSENNGKIKKTAYCEIGGVCKDTFDNLLKK